MRISAGIAELRHGETAAGLFERADSALYRAKELGKDRASVATDYERCAASAADGDEARAARDGTVAAPARCSSVTPTRAPRGPSRERDRGLARREGRDPRRGVRRAAAGRATPRTSCRPAPRRGRRARAPPGRLLRRRARSAPPTRAADSALPSGRRGPRPRQAPGVGRRSRVGADASRRAPRHRARPRRRRSRPQARRASASQVDARAAGRAREAGQAGRARLAEPGAARAIVGRVDAPTR